MSVQARVTHFSCGDEGCQIFVWDDSQKTKELPGSCWDGFMAVVPYVSTWPQGARVVSHNVRRHYAPEP